MANRQAGFFIAVPGSRGMRDVAPGTRRDHRVCEAMRSWPIFDCVHCTYSGGTVDFIATERAMSDKGNGIAGTTCIALAVAGLALTASLVLAYYATRARVEGLRASGG
ncbi:hypothetical protein [Cupriavidus taiwanensis]|nr:hypothetical protein [Cupriavidus taiwanensis]